MAIEKNDSTGFRKNFDRKSYIETFVYSHLAFANYQLLLSYPGHANRSICIAHWNKNIVLYLSY